MDEGGNEGEDRSKAGRRSGGRWGSSQSDAVAPTTGTTRVPTAFPAGVVGGADDLCPGETTVRQSSAPSSATVLIVDLVDGGLLVPGARHDVLVVYGDVAAQHRGRLLRLGEENSKSSEKRARRPVFAALA